MRGGRYSGETEFGNAGRYGTSNNRAWAGLTAGKDCHAVIETNRGHWLGQVIYSGCAQENTGVPRNIMGHTTRRVIRAPAAGIMRSNVKLGDLVKEGDVIAWIGEHEIKAPLTGMVRGLLNDGGSGRWF